MFVSHYKNYHSGNRKFWYVLGNVISQYRIFRVFVCRSVRSLQFYKLHFDVGLRVIDVGLKESYFAKHRPHNCVM